MTKFMRAARRATATFVFATAGQMATLSIFDTDVAAWKIIVGSGVSALANLAYRWSESALKEPEPIDVPGGDIQPDGG